MASRMASEIWSETLSGCPSETDSEVKRKSLLIATRGILAKVGKRVARRIRGTLCRGFGLRPGSDALAVDRSVATVAAPQVVVNSAANAILGENRIFFETPPWSASMRQRFACITHGGYALTAHACFSFSPAGTTAASMASRVRTIFRPAGLCPAGTLSQALAPECRPSGL